MIDTAPSTEEFAADLAAALAGTASEVGFAILCNNTDADGIAVIQKGIPYMQSLRSRLEALGHGNDMSHVDEVVARALAFLAANGKAVP
jgi:hypothetical protein